MWHILKLFITAGNEVAQVNIFTSVFQEFCPRGVGCVHGRGHVWQGGMDERGACVAGFVHGRGVCMAGGVHGRDMHVGGMCVAGGVHGRGACMAGYVHGRRVCMVGGMCGRKNGNCCGLLIPVLWTFGDLSSGFQGQSGQTFLSLADEHVFHIPRDSPLARHLLT